MTDILNFIQQYTDTIGLSLRHANSALDIAAKLKSLTARTQPSGNPELEGLVLSLINEISDAKLANIALKQQLLEMKQAALDAKKNEDKFDRYELWETPGGAQVYRLREGVEPAELMHYACPTCYNNGKISILQGGEYARSCHQCGTYPRIFRFTSHEPRSIADMSRELNS